MLRDVHINSEGDIELGPDGDLKIVIGDDALIDSIMFRIRTAMGDYVLEPDCGTNLETIIGQPNDSGAGILAESMIEDALTHDGFIASTDLSIRVSPLNYETLFCLIDVAGDTENYNIPMTIDLKGGGVQFVTQY